MNKYEAKKLDEVIKYFEHITVMRFVYMYELESFKTFSSFEFNSFLWQHRCLQVNLEIKLATINMSQNNQQKKRFYSICRHLRNIVIVSCTISIFYFAPGLVLRTLASQIIMNKTSNKPFGKIQNKILDHLFEKDKKGNRSWQLTRTSFVILGVLGSTVILTICKMYVEGGIKRNLFADTIANSLPTELPIIPNIEVSNLPVNIEIPNLPANIEVPKLPAPGIELWPLIDAELIYRNRMFKYILHSFGNEKKGRDLYVGRLPITDENIFDIIRFLSKLAVNKLSLEGYIGHLGKKGVPTNLLQKLTATEERYGRFLRTVLTHNKYDLGFIANYLAALTPTSPADSLNYNNYRISGASYDDIIQCLYNEYKRQKNK